MFVGKENAISMEHLYNGETVTIIGFGQSMTPVLKSGQPAIVEPITDDTLLSKGDIVFAKVNGNFYLHKISAIRGNKTYQISNNHDHVNGWVSRNKIYGKVTKILP